MCIYDAPGQRVRGGLRVPSRRQSHRNAIYIDGPEQPSDQALVQTTLYDQPGRAEEITRSDDTAPGVVTTDIRHPTISGTGAGSYAVQSNPYRSATDATMGWTLTQSDTLGRVVAIGSYSGSTAPPWGSNNTGTGTVTTSYSGLSQNVTDQAGVTRTLAMDGLGRLQSVTEAGTAVTSYTYDALDDLTSVAQGSLPNRTFAFDSQARLGSATNPESGTTTYTYDPNGNLTSKTDARGVKTNFTMDLYSRVTQKSYTSDPTSTPTVNYCYDGASWNGSACAGSPTSPSINRLTQVESSVSSTVYNYNALGQVVGSTQTTGSSSYPFGYTYNAAGSLLSETYPSSRTVTYSFDAAGRVMGALGNYNGNTTQYAGGETPISYAPQGAIASMPLGNTLTETRSYNPRLQTSGVTLGSVLTLGYTYPATGNNRRVSGISISGAGISGTINQTFGYDGFNRLNSFSETGNGANQSYGYDNYGNRWISSGWVNPAYSAQTAQSDVFTNNRWAYSPGSTCAGTGAVQYDCAGNQTSVSLGWSAFAMTPSAPVCLRAARPDSEVAIPTTS
jgi:YD repeat-containing protein